MGTAFLTAVDSPPPGALSRRLRASSSARMPLTAALLAAVFLTIYVPDIGHGFIKDDFGWIQSSVVDGPSELVALFGRNVGFYRPMVSVTFAADFAVWQLNPFGYGVTNLLLFAVDVLLLFALIRRFRAPAPAALVATAVWAFNFHAINMAVLWPSGRPSLLVAAFALMTVHALLSGRWIGAGLLCLAALLCKEEAVTLPAVLTLFILIEDPSMPWRDRLVRAVVRTWPLWAALLVYAVLRIQSGAFGPLDAPSYYRFTVSPAVVLRNVLEYADRAATIFLAVALVMAVALGRRPPALDGEQRRTLRFAALWFVGMYAVTVFLPVRSSLYAFVPSFGSALAAAVFVSLVLRTRPDRFARAAVALLVLLLVLVPVYRARNARWVVPAEISSRVMQTLEFAVSKEPAGGRFVLVDDTAERFNLDTAFGGLFPDAVALRFGPAWTGEIVDAAPASPAGALVYEFRGGTLVPVLREGP